METLVQLPTSHRFRHGLFCTVGKPQVVALCCPPQPRHLVSASTRGRDNRTCRLSDNLADEEQRARVFQEGTQAGKRRSHYATARLDLEENFKRGDVVYSTLALGDCAGKAPLCRSPEGGACDVSEGTVDGDQHLPNAQRELTDDGKFCSSDSSGGL